MGDSVKSKIYEIPDGIQDEAILNQVMEDIIFYTSKKDITDDLTQEQLIELDKSVEEADNNETITWDDFKKELSEWRKN